MAIDRFQDENILLNSKQPVENVPLYDTSDIVKLGSPFPSGYNGGYTGDELTNMTFGNSITEIHVYSGDNLLQSIENNKTTTITENGEPFIKLFKNRKNISGRN